jgi:hypothetical protein
LFDDAPGCDGPCWWTTPTSGDSYHYYLDIAGVMAAPYFRRILLGMQ